MATPELDGKDPLGQTRGEEKYLPDNIRALARRSGSEFAWLYEDFTKVVHAANDAKLGIIGGQIQFIFPDGACELYWLSYDTQPRQIGESWQQYCDRTADECLNKFTILGSKEDIIKEGVKSFDFLKAKQQRGVDLNNHLFCLIHFNDSETFLEP
jgi:hypothetical protein